MSIPFDSSKPASISVYAGRGPILEQEGRLYNFKTKEPLEEILSPTEIETFTKKNTEPIPDFAMKKPAGRKFISRGRPKKKR